MRDITQRELDLYESGDFQVATRVEVKDEDGIWVDLTQLDGDDWVKSIRISGDIDTDAVSWDINVQRNEFQKSLANLMVNSKYNVKDGDYSPLIEVSREIKISFAIYEEGNFSEDYFKEYFAGIINHIDWDSNPITITCKDYIDIMDYTYIEEEMILAPEDSYPDGRPIQDVMQRILNAWDTGLDLYVPEDPNSNTLEYEQSKDTVRKAIESLYMGIGWQVRMRNINGTFRPTLLPVERQQKENDFTFENYTVETYEKENRDVRNKIKVIYADEEGNIQNIVVKDQDSIDAHDVRYMEIQEGQFSQIYDESKAIDLGNYALSDLKEPKLEKTAYVAFFPWVHVGDRYKFLPDYLRTDVAQELFVIGFEINLDENTARTRIDLRGNPAMKFDGWLERDNRATGTTKESSPKMVRNLYVFSDYEILDDGTVTPYIKAEWNEPKYSEYNTAHVFLRRKIEQDELDDYDNYTEEEGDYWTLWDRIAITENTEYREPNVEKAIYEVKIITEDNSNNTSDFDNSPTMQVEVTGKIEKPQKVEFDRIEWKKDRIKLTWFPHPDPDFDEYEIRLDNNFGEDY